MSEITLESLAARLSALEKQVAEQGTAKPKKDWRRAVGKFDDDPDFMREIIAEGAAIRQAERDAAKKGVSE